MKKQPAIKAPLQVLILGCGDYFGRLRYHTSFVVLAGALRVLVDCPEPLRKIMSEASRKSGLDLDVDQLDHVLLTHLHGDHCGGVEGLGYYRHYVCRNSTRPHVYALPEVLPDLWNHRLYASMGRSRDAVTGKLTTRKLENYFQPHAVSPGKRYKIGSLGFEIRRTLHSIPCYAVKFQYAGVSLGYSCDTIYDPDLIGWLSDCDLIIHETSTGPHTPYEKLSALPSGLRRKMLLVHLGDNFDMKKSNILPARQGAIYTVTPGKSAREMWQIGKKGKRPSPRAR
ncbi:MAG: MBL fold metallo-hydrolase [bacterium]